MPSLAEIEAARTAAAPDLALAEPVTAEAEAEAASEAEAATELSDKGVLPEVAPHSLMAEPQVTASEQAFGAQPAPAQVEITGMFEPEAYQAACEAAGTRDRWHDFYVHGHTGAKQWTQPYEGRDDMKFTLKPEHSASQALQDFAKGPTIADYRVIAGTVELLELLDTMGERKFDRLFGSADRLEDAQIAQRLAITSDMYTTPFVAQMQALADERDAAEQSGGAPEPQVAAQVEDQAHDTAITEQPAPELIAEELGIEREHDFA